MEEGEKKYKEGIAYGLWAGWLFGFAGLHRLYLGKYGTGFLWLFTWGCLGIGQLYDLITMRRQVEEANLLEEARALRELRRAQPQRTPQQLLLDAAMREGGKLTVTQAAMITGYSFQEAEQVLREMVASGYVDVGNEPDSGVIVYYFPELRARPRIGREDF
ncbi:MAG: TM2 domain-containing protein [Gemmatimonadota bacterium]|nr:MAG: TM2 domain-containing protein [Gemmatimonadota bacterium]